MGQKKSKKRSILFEPKTLTVLGATALTTALTSWMWIPAVGIAGAGLLMLNNWRERKAASGSDTTSKQYAVPIPLMPASIEQKYRTMILRMTDLRRRLFEEIRHANELVRNMMDGSLSTIQSLGDRHTMLVLKLRDLSNYLEKSESEAHLEDEVSDLERRLSRTDDEVVREGLAQALDAKSEQLKVHRDLALGVERISAHLESMEASMDKIYGQVVQMKSAEARQASIESEKVSAAVADLSRNVDAFAAGIERTFGSNDVHISKG